VRDTASCSFPTAPFMSVRWIQRITRECWRPSLPDSAEVRRLTEFYEEIETGPGSRALDRRANLIEAVARKPKMPEHVASSSSIAISDNSRRLPPIANNIYRIRAGSGRETETAQGDHRGLICRAP
jgi:hypothetical protein